MTSIVSPQRTIVLLPQNELDDPAFIDLVASFVRAYAKLTSANRVYVTHIDNWFGERWLGFAGKFRGVAGIRQRRGKLGIDVRDRSLAVPPFRPSRVQGYAGFSIGTDGNSEDIRPAELHCEKNGGWIHTLVGDGLYFWYSGKTSENTNGCLMAYELSSGGQDAWYLNFSKSHPGVWEVVSCRNTQIVECRAIAAQHYAGVG